MNKQELRDKLFPNNPGNNATKEECLAHIEHLLQCGDECKDDLNRLAAEVVMKLSSKLIGYNWCWVNSDGKALYIINSPEHETLLKWNPCGDSNHFDKLAKEIYEKTSLKLAKWWTPSTWKFSLEHGLNYKTSSDNSAGVALSIIAAIESVFAENTRRMRNDLHTR